MSEQNIFAPVSGFPSPEEVKASYDSLTVRPLLGENNDHSREAIFRDRVTGRCEHRGKEVEKKTNGGSHARAAGAHLRVGRHGMGKKSFSGGGYET